MYRKQQRWTTEPTEDRKPEADIGNTEETESTTEESETETSTQAGDSSKDMEKIGGGLKQIKNTENMTETIPGC